ncbi:hypothetical protein BP5796_03269 [Coleophoma crateriformis]|uniref:U6 snRNA phosphodiesterase n=1 Tax=Coleophoma crateriformis TaxID=565419 RepID=A0A3D8SMN4_9HELO|nr:hypothetical protein BP5796_03269 [Coleophoma crateriformis]
MALVDYESSDEEEEGLPRPDAHPSNTLKRKHDATENDLPPLPSKFHDLYASTIRLSTRDDPSLHGGRKRVTPHIQGNWPTHLYIEWYPSTTEHEALTNLISSIQATLDASSSRIQSLLTSDLGVPLPLHISLSRTLGLSSAQKDDFVSALLMTMKSCKIRPFDTRISGLHWVPNYEKTRWFLVLRLERPREDRLNRLLAACNGVCEDFAQPKLYSSLKTVLKQDDGGSSRRRRTTARSGSSQVPATVVGEDASESFHVSIAWTLVPPSEEMIECTQRKIEEAAFIAVKEIAVHVTEIKAKVGNIVTNVPLPQRAVEGKGLFGF